MTTREDDYDLSTRPLKKRKRSLKEPNKSSHAVLISSVSQSKSRNNMTSNQNGLANDKDSFRKNHTEHLLGDTELDDIDQEPEEVDSASVEDMNDSDDESDTDQNTPTIVLDEDLQHRTGTTKTVSRIRLRDKNTITPSHHIEHTEISNGKVVDAKSSFATIDVVPWLIASLAAMEIRRPTAIQKSCIPQILKGQDVIGGSKTGSGKTVTFAVPIIQKWAEDPMGIFALVLTPTRELALQIFEQFNAISAPQSMKTILITGGTELRTQAIALASRPHVVIATPGRLADHINTSGSDTIAGFRRTRIVVLDEADRLLAPGPGSMLPDVETCLGALPPSSDRQTCLFTATLTQEVMALRDMPRSNRAPIFVCDIDSESDLAIPTTLQQTFLLVPPVMKEAYLHILLLTPINIARKSIIVFCNRTKTADLLERLLRGLDHSVTSLHSKLPQRDRTSNLAKFRARVARILIASDVASRGLDIPEVDLVINYDVPRNPDDYIHRVGRSARAGRKGNSVIMVDRRDIELILAIEARVGQKMTEYEEADVNIQTRVVRDALKLVGEKKREVIIGIEEGRDVKGNRTRGRIRRLE